MKMHGITSTKKFMVKQVDFFSDSIYFSFTNTEENLEGKLMFKNNR